MSESDPLLAASGAERRAIRQAEDRGLPFLVLRSGSGDQLIRLLPERRTPITLGRHASCNVSVDWDETISRTHAVLERLGHEWTLADDGLSRNGTFLNGARLTSRRRLIDGDHLRIGQTVITFRNPSATEAILTSPEEMRIQVILTPAQRRVLVALCRPFKSRDPFTTPATNIAIADELFVSVDAVKTHMRTLFTRLHVDDLPQNQKRAKLVERAFELGLVTLRDL
jgi:pSer/pThr/pTyr-binding forkhead associated (FHA) protein